MSLELPAQQYNSDSTVLTTYLSSTAHNTLDENSHYLYGVRANGSSPGSPPVVTSSGHAGNMLVVPQPTLLSTKLPGGHAPMPPGYLTGGPAGVANNTGRKYQCKMCPQVSSMCAEANDGPGARFWPWIRK